MFYAQPPNSQLLFSEPGIGPLFGGFCRARRASGVRHIKKLQTAKKEEFLNTDENWYVAKELQLYERWADFELKTPGLGDLQIVMKKWGDDELSVSIAQFPKGTWEFARLIPE